PINLTPADTGLSVAFRSGPAKCAEPPQQSSRNVAATLSGLRINVTNGLDVELSRAWMTLMPLPSKVRPLSVASRRGPARLNVLPLPMLTKNPPEGGRPNVAGEDFKDTNGADELLDTVPAPKTSMPLVAVIGVLTALRSGPLSST